MKERIVLIVILGFIKLSVYGQNFISSEKQWNVRLFGGYGLITEIFIIDDDSIIDSISYSKIWLSSDSLTTRSFQGLLREEAGVVYYIPPNLNEGILYNFNLEIGDTANIKNIFCGNEEIPINVIGIDTVEYFGIYRKRWHLDSYGGTDEFWVEGIGSLNGPLYTKYWYCIICSVWELLCFHYNDTLEYISPYETECYQNTVGIDEHENKIEFVINPNPIKKGPLIYINTNSVSNNISIYNSSGVLVKNINNCHKNTVIIETTNFNSGIYFVKITTSEKTVKTQKILIQ